MHGHKRKVMPSSSLSTLLNIPRTVVAIYSQILYLLSLQKSHGKKSFTPFNIERCKTNVGGDFFYVKKQNGFVFRFDRQ